VGQSKDKYEGGQGRLTREQQQAERIGLGGVRKEEEEPGPEQFRKAQKEGGARLDEDREQHDDAELNSERNRGDLRRERPTHRDDTGPGKSAGH